MNKKYFALFLSVCLFLFLFLFLSPVKASTPPVCDNSMMSYWKFDEGSGTTAIDSMGTYNGVISGAQYVQDKIAGNYALKFSASNANYVEIPSSFLSEYPPAGTISLWAKMDAVQQYPYPYLWFKGHSYSFMIATPVPQCNWLPGGCFRFNQYDGSENHNAYTSAPVQTDIWYYVTYTWGDNGMKIYLDGNLAGEEPYTGGSDGFPIDFEIGGDWHFSNYFSGIIDEFSVYNRALSIQEIQDNYQRGLMGQSYCVKYSVPQLSSLSPANVWIGLQNSQDKGIKYDLKAEAYVGNTLVSSGELDSVEAGTAGFDNANLNSIPFNSFTPVDFPQGSTLNIKLYARNACVGSKNNGKTARLWYNDNQANSGFGVTIGENTNNYYLVNNSSLSTDVGSGPKLTVDVNTKTKCAPFASFGTWTVTP